MVTKCQGFLRRECRIQFCHTYRAASIAADELTSLAYYYNVDVIVLLDPLEGDLNFPLNDGMGRTIPHIKAVFFRPFFFYKTNSPNSQPI